MANGDRIQDTIHKIDMDYGSDSCRTIFRGGDYDMIMYVQSADEADKIIINV